MNAINNFIKNTNIWLLLATFAAILNLLTFTFWHINTSLNINIYFLLLLPLIYAIRIDPKKTIIVITIIIILGLALISEPIIDWDARSIWFFQAKKLFYTSGYAEQLSNYAKFGHNDYPPLMASIAANIAHSIHIWDDTLTKLAILLTVLPVIFLFAFIFNNQYYSILFLAIPLIATRQLFNGYMDVMVGIYLSCILIYLFYLNSSQSRNLKYNPTLETIILLLLTVSLSLLKNEGFMGLILLCFTFLINYKIISLKNLLILFVAVAFNYILWRYHVSAANLTSDLFVGGIHTRFISRVTDLTQLFAVLLLPATEFGLFLVFYLLVYKISNENPFHKALFTFIFLYTVAMLCIYLITPHDLFWHIATSASRVFIPMKILLTSIIIYTSFSTHLNKSNIK